MKRELLQLQENLVKSFQLVETDRHFSHYIADRILDSGHRIIGIFGASASGKTTFSKQLHDVLGKHRSVLISVDDYWCYTREEMKQLKLTGYDWETRDKERFLEDLRRLQEGQLIEKPFQDYEHERPSTKTERVEPRDIIILEATLDFTGIADFIIFTYAPDDVLIQRRLKRDAYKKAFPTQEALEEYVRMKSIPAYKRRLLPLASSAHVIVDTHQQKVLEHNASSQRCLMCTIGRIQLK